MKKFWTRLKLVFSNYKDEELIAQLVKVELGLLADEEIDIIKNVNLMPPEKRLEYLYPFFQFARSEPYKDLKAIVIGNFLSSTINGASTFNHFICGKMSIYGTKYFCEQVEYLAARYQQEQKEIEKISEEVEEEEFLQDVFI